MDGFGGGATSSHRRDAPHAGRGANGDAGDNDVDDAARKRKIPTGRRKIASRRFSSVCFSCWAGRWFRFDDGGGSLGEGSLVLWRLVARCRGHSPTFGSPGSMEDS